MLSVLWASRRQHQVAAEVEQLFDQVETLCSGIALDAVDRHLAEIREPKRPALARKRAAENKKRSPRSRALRGRRSTECYASSRSAARSS
jgi:ElaB/YqjD/DUF883 family membrane-anchored ribosome-binding protein